MTVRADGSGLRPLLPGVQGFSPHRPRTVDAAQQSISPWTGRPTPCSPPCWTPVWLRPRMWAAASTSSIRSPAIPACGQDARGARQWSRTSATTRWALRSIRQPTPSTRQLGERRRGGGERVDPRRCHLQRHRHRRVQPVADHDPDRLRDPRRGRRSVVGNRLHGQPRGCERFADQAAPMLDRWWQVRTRGGGRGHSSRTRQHRPGSVDLHRLCGQPRYRDSIHHSDVRAGLPPPAR
jgi:hypothetical protein